MEKQYYTRQNLIMVFFMGTIIGFGAYYLVDRGDRNTSEDTKTEKVSEVEEVDNGTSFTYGENSVSANDQPAGLSVAVDEFTLAQDGWIVVKEDANGTPGNILGAQRYDAGLYTEGKIELLRNTEEGNIYYVSVYADDGDKEFDHSKDREVLNGQGVPVMVSFSAIRIK